MTEPKQAKRYARTRAAHAAETAEDYVEAIAEMIESRGECRVTDLREHFGVSHVTVVKILNRLRNEGLVQTETRTPIELTKTGSKLAEQSRERHLIVFEFLRAIGVSANVAAIDAEGIEHHVSDETLRRFQQIARNKRI
ncbi:MAG: manganese-binding transcriptional regulator MntR [Phycisphaerae bacterium]